MVIGNLSRIRTFIGIAFALISLAGFFVVFFMPLASVLLETDFIPMNVVQIAIASIAALTAVHLLLLTKSFYWFIPAQAFALAATMSGASAVAILVMTNWQQLLGVHGFFSVLSLASGLGVSLAANKYLVRSSSRQNA